MKLIALAAFAGAAVLMSGTAAGQQGVGFSKVEVKISDLGNKTYRLEGAGGNVTVAVGSDGIIMVDGQFAPMHDKLKAALATLSDQPIKYLINTPFHGDHVGGNGPFQAEGVTVVAQDNVRIRLAAGTRNGITGVATPPGAAGGGAQQTHTGRSRNHHG